MQSVELPLSGIIFKN